MFEFSIVNLEKSIALSKFNFENNLKFRKSRNICQVLKFFFPNFLSYRKFADFGPALKINLNDLLTINFQFIDNSLWTSQGFTGASYQNRHKVFSARIRHIFNPKKHAFLTN